MELQQQLPSQLKANQITPSKSIKNFFIQQQLGQGSYGKVYKVINQQTSQLFALKVVNKQKILNMSNQKRKQRNLRYLKQQGINMLRCKNDHVVKCYHIYTNKFIRMFLMQYCQGGTMMQTLKDKFPLNQSQIIPIFKQLLAGITEIHRKGLIHRDLKFSNIYFHQGKYKIGDLGIAKLQIDFILATKIGTTNFMAPQILDGKQYSQNSDIWSLGVIFYYLLFNQYPYNPKQSSFSQMLKQIKMKEPKYEFNQLKRNIKLVQIVKAMLEKNPKKRPDYIHLINLIQGFDISGLSFSKIYLTEPNIKQMQKQKSVFSDKQEIEQQNQIQSLKEQSKIIISKSYQRSIKYKQMYLDARLYHFKGLKAEFILNKIIKVIKKEKLLYADDRLQKELMYLLCQRCWIYITYCKQQVLKNKQLRNLVSKEYVVKLTEQIEKYFNESSQSLRIQQQKLINMLKDGVDKILNNESYLKKNEVLNGIEKHDYSYEEQIKVTCEHLKKWMNKQQQKYKEDIQSTKESTKIQKQKQNQQLCKLNKKNIQNEKNKVLKKLLCNYEKINLIDCDACYGKCSTFIQEVRQILYPLQLN